MTKRTQKKSFSPYTKYNKTPWVYSFPTGKAAMEARERKGSWSPLSGDIQESEKEARREAYQQRAGIFTKT